ncbi:hypothetical protein [Pontivivens nitratireducens]|uniref:Glutamine amidotransferase domain-containing protein n=1 Tax=Pontivivens nitratireducens TaxID=2758038 RepID=A0A6G7VP16_9RHOB|nr:hypothetical protein [Pontibrevibacter nitratireducens]QIK41598.1 hypothetical protein G8E03_13045 [Pontibrevibacter nitratireducens]
MSGVVFSPLVPMVVIVALAGGLTALCLYAAWMRLTGWALRGLGGLVLLLALSGPSLKEEDRAPLTDIAFLLVDRSDSQSLGVRPDQIARAEAELSASLDALSLDPDAPLEWRRVEVGDASGADEGRGTLAMRALSDAVAGVAPDRIAGAILLSDGQVHDMADAPGLDAPLHLVLTGEPREWDRKLSVVAGPAFGIVGEKVQMTLRVDELGFVPRDRDAVTLSISLDGEDVLRLSVPVGEDITFDVPIARGGMNVLQASVAEGTGELTPRNNTALIEINGIRDRLRVLLVSGEPHAGGRTWRNLLKSDAAVDLVHFTILRPPSKQDGVPVFEMSLIAFPTRELFMEKIDEFDLIIFDRYRRRGVLPPSYLDNIARYVEDGGAVLVASGPAFAGVESLWRTPLARVLPADPTARVIEEGYLPRISELGARHPVTAGLEDYAPRPAVDGVPGWGRWFRLIDLEQTAGDTVMEGPDGRPLLILDRPGQGRIAMLASDHAWLWARGYEGGGPQVELLRRLAHWLMQEPELEEEVLLGDEVSGDLLVTRRTLGDVAPTLELTAPDETIITPQMVEVGPGRWEVRVEDPVQGLWRLRDGDVTGVAAVGNAAPREFENALSTDEVLKPLIDATDGGAIRVSDGVPDLRRVREGRNAAGRGWLGLADRDAYTVENVSLTPLAPAWLMLLLTATLILGAWRIESR